MLESIPIALSVGTVLGFLSGLGVGGGSLLVLWLTLVLGMNPETARGINLLFFLPSACIACLLRWKQGTLSLRPLLPAVMAGCAAAAIFSFLGALLPMEILRKLFGGLLLITGLRELFYRPRKKER